MSLFNKLVPRHPLSTFLLIDTRWGVSCDPDKKYPLTGRLRYIWMGEDYKTIKLLLKDGESSWSQQKEEISLQICNHENFISVKHYEKDPVYLIAEFGLSKDYSWVERVDPKDRSIKFGFSMDEEGDEIFKKVTSKGICSMTPELIRTIQEGDDAIKEDGYPSILEDPFDLLERELANTKMLGEKGIISSTAKEIIDQIEKAVEKKDDGNNGPILIGL